MLTDFFDVHNITVSISQCDKFCAFPQLILMKMTKKKSHILHERYAVCHFSVLVNSQSSIISANLWSVKLQVEVK